MAAISIKIKKNTAESTGLILGITYGTRGPPGNETASLYLEAAHGARSASYVE